MTGIISRARAPMIMALLMLFGMLLAGCGADATPTTAPAAATATSAPVATATKATTAPTATIAMAAPTATMPTSEITPTESGPSIEPTPASDWKPGAHAGTVPAPSKLVSAGILTIG
ncbi:MAG TPA: hypothetical protein VLQ48_14670, partial [Chloroflexia bacterium]|nr:hypothetical protein [Chloroflexia bacterium]